MNSSLKYLKILSGLYKHSVETIMLCAPKSPVLNQETPNNSFCLFVSNHLSLLNLFTASSQHYQVEFELTAF